MSASPYRCSKCGRLGLAAIGDGRTGEQIKPVGESFDLCMVGQCTGRLLIITVDDYDRESAAR